MIYKKKVFEKALPIWKKGESLEMNKMLLFCTEINKTSDIKLKITGHTGYRVFINQKFIFWGPARAGRGFYRVDEIDLNQYLVEDINDLTVISTGYNCSSYYTLNEQSFLCAEVVSEGQVICATGYNGWKVYDYDNHLQKVQRYNTQRTFCEVYDFYTTGGDTITKYGHREVQTEICNGGEWIARDTFVPTFPYQTTENIVADGYIENILAKGSKPMQTVTKYMGIGDVSGYKTEECDILSVATAERMVLSKRETNDRYFPTMLAEKEYIMSKLDGNRTGFIYLELDCIEDTELFLTFDETLTDGVINFRRSCSNVVIYRLKGGMTYKLMTAEPYTYQYINLIATKGKIRVCKLGMYRVEYNQGNIICELNEDKADEAIKRIYHAAVQTFCQNTFDIFMDCPSRERAGWLCDSFFTARVEKLLTGNNDVEHNFLANYIMAKSFPHLPQGVIPMCYPADHDNQLYIPNWMMWYALELKEYLERTKDRTLVDEAKQMLYGVLSFLKKYENSQGLLEHLEGWVFVEWSKSNELVQDISYPSNMLYYMFKRTMSELYEDIALLNEADILRKTIRQKSKTELFFCDNSVYDENGVEKLSGEYTESCQYYAFFTGVASIAEDGELWKTLVADFGPERKKTKKWREVHFANAFIGNYLRLELLCNAGYYQELEDNIRGYFDYMAIQTDTLWEHDSVQASCNHGFASHVLVWLDRLGYLKK